MAHEELIRWSNDNVRPKWQRDALRRIAKGGGGNTDVLELRKIIEKEVGLTDEQVSEVVPLSASDLSSAAADTPHTTLTSLGPLEGFDRLESNQEPLKFSKTGLTVVYGQNASGKSGYCRIAKELCRSLSPAVLRGNVYDDVSTSEQTVELSFCVGEDEHKLTWKVDDDIPDELGRISVFDTASARVYVDSARKLEFLPYELDLLSKLGSLILNMETHFKERRDIINNANLGAYIGNYNDGTSVRSLLEKLLSSTDPKTVPPESEFRNLSKYDDDLKKERQAIENEIRSNPAARIPTLSMIKRKLEDVQKEISLLSTRLGSEGIKMAHSALTEKASKAKAAQVTASGMFENLPISEVGSDSWVHMLRYARDFAAEVYPDKDEPKISNADYCVLCQQPLAETASKRLAKFDDYMLKRSKGESEAANENYNRIVNDIRSTKVMTADQVKESLLEYGEMSDFRKKKYMSLIEHYTKLDERVVAVNEAIKNEDFSKVLEAGITYEDMINCIKCAIKEIDDELKKLEEIKKEGEGHTKRINTRLEALIDIERLNREIETVIDHRKKVVELLKLEKAIVLCGTRSITMQVNKRTEELLTETLLNKLTDELRALDISHIPIVPTKKGSRGESSVSMKLKARKPVKNSDILSEGEQRSLALACFLAELSEMGSMHGVVIDDPVSSLDYERMDAVADRLVKEASDGRQIVIFTHSISFYHKLSYRAKNAEVDFTHRTISSMGGNRFGMIDIDGNVPGNLMRSSARIGKIREEIPKLRKRGYDPKNRDFGRDVDYLYNSMRKAWERVVEEILFNEVIKRFEPGVRTKSLRGAHYTPEEDYNAIDKGMTECSKFTGHDWADETPLYLPSMEKIESDFEDLSRFYDRVSQRRGKHENGT